MKLSWRIGSALLGVMLVALLAPAPAAAQEVTIVVGRFGGDGIADAVGLPDVVGDAGLDDAALYGGRIGIGFFPFDLEASVVVSPTSVFAGTIFETDVRVLYAEVNALVTILPGPVSPFVTGGIGLHSFKLDVGNDPSESRLGYSIGGGVKVSLGRLGVRADFRDHITPIDLADLDPAFLGALGLEDDLTLHNLELSAGLTLGF